MKAINNITYGKISTKHGNDFNIKSDNDLVSGLLNEISRENKKPLKLDNESGRDDSVTKYFENSYAYVRFSK